MRIQPKKRLGQNFLVDANIQKKILAAMDLKLSDTALEIGSGRGELTQLVAPIVRSLFAVEIDRQMIGELAEKLKSFSHVRIIPADILKVDFRQLLSGYPRKTVVFGNIPYYITSPVIVRLIESRRNFQKIFLTVQKEFTQRIAARTGGKDYGAFTCYVQYYLKPKILFEIKKNSFYPAPKVDSCFLELEIKKKLPLAGAREAELFKIIRAAFNKRRKVLRNSLKGLVAAERLAEFLKSRALGEDIRPERLSLQEFISLINFLRRSK